MTRFLARAFGGVLLIICAGLLLFWRQDISSGSPRPRCAASARPTETAALISQVQTLPDTPLLYDTFTSSTASGLQTRDDDNVIYAFDSDAYRIEVKAPALLAWSLLDGRYRDVTVQVDSTLVDGPANTSSGLMFRYQDADNFYIFNVANNGLYNLERVKDGHQMVLIDWTPSEHIHWLPTGPTSASTSRKPATVHNRLRVTLTGERIGLFVNGSLLEETMDATFSEGAVALTVNTFTEQPAAVCFDNVLITSGSR